MGGFALSGNSSDPDITAIVLQAFIPYYDSETVYSNGKTVKTIVDEAFRPPFRNPAGQWRIWQRFRGKCRKHCPSIDCLMCISYRSPYGSKIYQQERQNSIDGLMNFYNSSDGGFIHASSTADQKQQYCKTDRARYALVAYYRYVNGLRPLYDYREESNVSAQKIEAIITEIEQLPETATMEDFENHL